MKWSKAFRQLFTLCACASFFVSCSNQQTSVYQTYPANGGTEICPDTHLKITFKNIPEVGERGMIRVYDWETDELA